MNDAGRSAPRVATLFAGSAPFSVAAFESILDATGNALDVRRVWTTPDRKAGRALKYHPTAVAEWAAVRNVPVSKHGSLRDPTALDELSHLGAPGETTLAILVAYGKIVPPEQPLHHEA